MPSKQDLLDFWKKAGLIKDRNALSAFMAVERKNFMTEETEAYAYEDAALPIICGQTISQPSTVMMMTQALELRKGMKVLEIGSGSGYQAAIISKIIGPKGKLYTTEIIPELVEFARNNLMKAHIKNVKVIHSDGSMGYSKEAPYDRIIVTAAAPSIPKPLIKQLKVNGIMVIPVGTGVQKLIKVVKHKNSVEKADLGYFRFVPLRGKHGISE